MQGTETPTLLRDERWVPRPDERRCPHCGEDLPGRVVRDEWLEVSLGNGWRCALRVMADEGRPVVAEVRVFPDEPGRRPAGEWSAQGWGNEASVPPGGLKARTLRDVRLDTFLKTHLAELLEGWPFPPGSPRMVTAPRRSQRQREGDRKLAEVAAEYLDLCTAPETRRAPRKALRDAHGWSEAQARKRIDTARDRGLLAGTLHGKSGGYLTEYAHELLASSPTEEDR